jgi:hypothetical protein
MKIRTGTIAAAAMIVGAATLFGFTGTASAIGPCTADNACLWSAANFTGMRFNNFNSQPSWHNITYDGTNVRLWERDGVANNVSSLDNWDLDSTIAVYYNSGYAGPCFTVAAGGQASNFAQIPLGGVPNGRANDNMNSHHFNQRCGAVYDF